MKVEIGKMTWDEYTKYILNNYSAHEISPHGVVYEAIVYTAEDILGHDLISGGVFFTTFEEAEAVVLKESPELGGQVSEIALIATKDFDGEVCAKQPIEFTDKVTPVETAVGKALKSSITVVEYPLLMEHAQ